MLEVAFWIKHALLAVRAYNYVSRHSNFRLQMGILFQLFCQENVRPSTASLPLHGPSLLKKCFEWIHVTCNEVRYSKGGRRRPSGPRDASGAYISHFVTRYMFPFKKILHRQYAVWGCVLHAYKFGGQYKQLKCGRAVRIRTRSMVAGGSFWAPRKERGVLSLGTSCEESE